MPVRRGLMFAILAGLAIAAGVVAWIIYLTHLGPEAGQDWMVFHAVAKSWLHGDSALAFDGNRLTALINARHADWLNHPLGLHPWLYPPCFLLLLLPFGALPFFLSWGLFQALTAALLALALWHSGQRGGARAVLIVAAALCPAVPFNLLLGQNGFLTAALLVGGFALLPSAPLLGGVLFGVLTFKPQLALLVPVALLATGNRRALAGMALGATALALASVAVFGWTFWMRWLELMLLPNPQWHAWLAAGRDGGVSLYACAVVLGAGPRLADLVQWAGTAAAAGGVILLMRRPLPAALRFAGLLIATILAAPHVENYDMTILGIAAGLIFCHGLAHGFRHGDIVFAFLLWVSPLANPPAALVTGLLTPLLLASGLVWLLLRAPARDRPAARPSPEAALIPASIAPNRSG